MPYTLDSNDIRVLKALMEDGRRSYREVGRIVGLSTPTVKTRITRMEDIGLIKKVVPILDAEKIASGILAIVSMSIEPGKLKAATESLTRLDQVRSIYVMTGAENVLLKVACKDVRDLQQLVETKFSETEGVVSISSQVLTETVKDEPGFPLLSESRILIDCDLCGKRIEGSTEKLRVGESDRFFCCKSCLALYKQKYGAKIRALSAKSTDVSQD